MERPDGKTPGAAIVTDLPFVSVIMPVHNEAAFIERSLTAVLEQSYPSERLEILLADGRSTDNTRECVARLVQRYSAINVIVLDNPGRTAPKGLNVGLGQACGEIIVRVDGHCEIAPDYVAKCVQHLRQGKADGVGGPIETVGETVCARAIALAMSSPFGVGGVAFRTIRDRTMDVDTVAFPGYTRQAIEKAGLFDEELVRNQDDEYNYRLRKLGGRILLTPEIKARYYSRSSWRSLWRQYFQYGYWKVRVMQKHPRQMRLRQFVPFAFVASLLLALALSLFVGFAPLALVAGSYLVANLAAAIITAPGRLWPLVSLSFAILHLSYGFGSLSGLLRFYKHWGRNI